MPAARQMSRLLTLMTRCLVRRTAAASDGSQCLQSSDCWTCELNGSRSALAVAWWRQRL
ncbi:hypothetical protein CERZMDRAFT_90497 [Cercospora zeae-maydis SCOH1-5]|uniref:Ig-like domain-containing protein n=1 Tax=Cercospora zeae-maydis SCOH1-5 TaxID=717836 RepID=A0A6A6FJS0_9PEZI|nr:hypothetical protein CERZMDRAFT_90497 [Cercospora zeae-maydis SCOH1-5]